MFVEFIIVTHEGPQKLMGFNMTTPPEEGDQIAYRTEGKVAIFTVHQRVFDVRSNPDGGGATVTLTLNLFQVGLVNESQEDDSKEPESIRRVPKDSHQA